jgi:hypothetical protein
MSDVIDEEDESCSLAIDPTIEPMVAVFRAEKRRVAGLRRSPQNQRGQPHEWPTSAMEPWQREICDAHENEQS